MNEKQVWQNLKIESRKGITNYKIRDLIGG